MRLNNFALLLFPLFLFMLFQSSCIKELPYECNPGTRFFTLKVNGDTLDDYYTIRVSTNDKLRSFYVFEDNKYWVLDDSWLDKLQGKQETFVFKGVLNNKIVVNETYIFRRGECHVEKIYGKAEVDI